MCDPTITPPVPAIDKDTPQAKVFIEGKNRPLFVAETDVEVGLRINAARRDNTLVEVTNINGEVTRLPHERIVSVVAKTPRERRAVEIVGNPLHGKRVVVRALTADDFANLPDLERAVGGMDPTGLVAVEGEDLGQHIVAVIVPETGQVVFGDALTERATKRYLKIARLTVEALAIEDAEAATADPAVA